MSEIKSEYLHIPKDNLSRFAFTFNDEGCLCFTIFVSSFSKIALPHRHFRKILICYEVYIY